MQHFGRAALRVTKNYTKGYSDTQAKVRDATSNDAWGPSGTQMNEIAQMTYNQGDFVEIMEMLDKRLNDKGKNWRHVFKSLTVLDYCLHQGSENVVIYFRDNIYIIKTLKEFQYIDEEGRDQGANVRQKAKDITNLLMDEGRLRTERRTRANMRERMVRGTGAEDGAGASAGGDDDGSRRKRQPRRDEGDELRRAIEESKRTLHQEQIQAEERQLQEALKMSEEEEKARAKAVDDSNSNALFDDQNQLPSPQNQNNNPFPTMSDPTPYTVGLQPQFTQIQPQFTSFNPYQQQMQQEAAQQAYLEQQQLFMMQQQQAQAQQEAMLAQQQQEDWMRQQQQMQWQQQQQQQQQFSQQQLMPQPTGFGSNNPFAPQQQQSPPPMPGNNNLGPPSFNLQGTYQQHDDRFVDDLSRSNISSPGGSGASPIPQQQPSPSGNRPIQVKPKKDENQDLANLFANRDDGMDTFGNTGMLRYGHSNAGRLATQQTGKNPFAMQQQQQSSDQPFFSI